MGDEAEQWSPVVQNALAIANLQARVVILEESARDTNRKLDSNNRLAFTTLLVALGSLIGIIFEYLKIPH